MDDTSPLPLDAPLDPAEISVLVVVLGVSGGRNLAACTQALANQTHTDLTVAYVATEDALRRPGAEAFGGARVAVDSMDALGAACNKLSAQWSRFDLVVFCRDDIALEPDAIDAACHALTTTLAGAVGAKVFSAENPDVLVEVGMSADRYATPYSRLEGLELDQAQYDAARRTLFASFAFLGIRAPLLDRLGGFDADLIGPCTELDMCWRVGLLGEDVVYAPEVRVRYLEPEIHPPDELALTRRNRIRVAFKNYNAGRALMIGVQALLLAVAQAVAAILSGKAKEAPQYLAPWGWNLRNLASTRAARAKVQKVRTVGDTQITRLMLGGTARLRSLSEMRAAEAGESRAEGLQRTVTDAVVMLGGKWVAVAALFVIFFVLCGWQLLGGPIPQIGRLAPATGSAFAYLGKVVAPWRDVDFGSAAATPPSVGLTGLVGVPLFGSVATAQRLLLLFGIPLAAWQLARNLRPLLDHRPARVMAALVYGLGALLWNAQSKGELGVVVAAMLLPAIARRLAHLAGLGGYSEGVPALRRTLELGVLTAVMLAAEPAMIWAPFVILLGWLAAAPIAGAAKAIGRTFGRAAVALVGALVLLAPWSVGLVFPSGFVNAMGGDGIGYSFADLVRFSTGTFGPGTLWRPTHIVFAILSFAFLVAAAQPLVIARGIRFEWAVRWWGTALVAWLFAWVVGRHWLPDFGRADALVLPAFLGLSICVGLGIQAIRTDLPEHRFSLRHPGAIASPFAVVLVLLAPLTSLGGRYGLGDADWRSSLAFQRNEAELGGFANVFLGRGVPGDSHPLVADVRYGVASPGGIFLPDLWLPATTGGASSLRGTLEAVLAGAAPNAGALLANYGIKYVAVPKGDDETVRALQRTLDLGVLYRDSAGTVFRNRAWRPTVSGSRQALPERSLTPTQMAALPPVERFGVWRQVGDAAWQGPTGANVIAAVTYDSDFRLLAAGKELSPTTSLGWGMQFRDTPAAIGDGLLVLRAGPLRAIVVTIVAFAWLVVLAGIVGMRGRDGLIRR